MAANDSRYHRILGRLLILVVLLIAYGSLYPWQYQRPPRGLNAITALLEMRPGLLTPRDFLLNLAVYVPLGFLAYLTFRAFSPRINAVKASVLLGIGLSTVVEMLQAYVRARRSNIFDILANGLGTGAGVALAIAFAASSRRLRSRDAGALAVITCWIGWLWFPFVPILHTEVVGTKLEILLRPSGIDFLSLVSAFANWYLAGLLISSAGFRYVKVTTIMSLALLLGQVCIAGRQPSFSHLIGATAGVAVSILGLGFRRTWFAISFLGLIALRGLSPFHLQAPQRFEWTPFWGPLHSDWLVAVQVLLEKVYFYSAAIWSFQSAGVRLLRATVVVGAVLLFIECCQIFLRGRTAEITDPLLALLIGFALASFKRTSSPSGTSA